MSGRGKLPPGPHAALPRHCSDDAPSHIVDMAVFSTPRAEIGTFRCPSTHPDFREAGRISRCLVVFPRTGVWIRHEGSRAFLADPSIATIYNRAQRYERFVASPDGDRCEWFGVSDDLAREIAGAFDPSAADAERPFRFEWAPSAGGLYVRQRVLARRALARDLDVLEGEEAVIGIVAAVIGAAHAHVPRPRAHGARAAGRHRALADAARAELLRTMRENRSVGDLASAIGTSPYHLCRVFRACTGRTMHEHRTALRVRVALERLEHAPSAGANLATLAHDLGFASHAHFVRAMRQHAGATPSAARALVRAGLAPPDARRA